MLFLRERANLGAALQEEKVERILVTTFDNYVEESLKPSYVRN
jgi:hypothetical protein